MGGKTTANPKRTVGAWPLSGFNGKKKNHVSEKGGFKGKKDKGLSAVSGRGRGKRPTLRRGEPNSNPPGISSKGKRSAKEKGLRGEEGGGRSPDEFGKKGRKKTLRLSRAENTEGRPLCRLVGGRSPGKGLFGSSTKKDLEEKQKGGKENYFALPILLRTKKPTPPKERGEKPTCPPARKRQKGKGVKKTFLSHTHRGKKTWLNTQKKGSQRWRYWARSKGSKGKGAN